MDIDVEGFYRNDFSSVGQKKASQLVLCKKNIELRTRGANKRGGVGCSVRSRDDVTNQICKRAIILEDILSFHKMIYGLCSQFAFCCIIYMYSNTEIDLTCNSFMRSMLFYFKQKHQTPTPRNLMTRYTNFSTEHMTFSRDIFFYCFGNLFWIPDYVLLSVL